LLVDAKQRIQSKQNRKIPFYLFFLFYLSHVSRNRFVILKTRAGLFFALVIIALVSILSLSREFVSATVPTVSYFETSGALLLAELNWSSILLDFPFVLSTLILNYLFYKSKLIPRWLSGWGLIGATLFLVSAFLPMLSYVSSSTLVLLHLTGAVNQMVLAVWLIVKGFNSSTIGQAENQK
jgi:hypothetical protein